MNGEKKNLISDIKQYLQYMAFTQPRLASFVVVDFCNNFFLHFLDTIKVRNQARSTFTDTSMFNRNQVTSKGIYILK